MSVCGLTAAFARWDGCTLVFDVQSTSRVEDGVNEDVRLTLLQHVQHLLQEEEETTREREDGNIERG